MKKQIVEQNPDLFPLTIAQEEILLDNEGSNDEYQKYSNMEGFFMLDPHDFSAELMNQAWNRIIAENDSLRLQIVKSGKKYLQKINPPEEKQLPILKAEDHDALVTVFEALEEEYVLPEDEVMWKAWLGQSADGSGGFAIRMVHTCTYGFAIEMVYQRLITIYDGLKNGKEIPEQKSRSYRDAVEFDQKYLSGTAFEEDKRWWFQFYKKQFFSNYSIPTGSRAFGGNVTTSEFFLGKELSEAADRFCEEHLCSIQSMLMTLSALAVYRLTGKNNFVFWCLTHGRPTLPLRKTSGCLTRTIPMQFLFSDQDELGKMVEENYSNYLDTMKHGRYPMRKHIILYIWKSVFLGYNFAHNWMVFSSMLYAEDPNALDYELHYYEGKLLTSQFYIGLTRSVDRGYRIGLEYVKDDYTKEETEWMFQVLKDTLQHTVEHPEAKIDSLFINRNFHRHRRKKG